MPSPFAQRKPTALQTVGVFVFVFLCGVPALEMNGLGFDIPFSLSTALICATVGGAIGGMMICPRPVLAGLIGGLVAGPLGLIAVYYYAQHRSGDFWDLLWDLEVVIVQGVASLPGLGVGWWLKRTLAAGADRGPLMSDKFAPSDTGAVPVDAGRRPLMWDNERAHITVSRRKTLRVLFMAVLFLLIACLLAATVFRVYVERFYKVVFSPSPPYAFDESIELADVFFYGDPDTTNMVLWTDTSRREVEAFYLYLQGVDGPIGTLDADITGVSIYPPGNDPIDIPESTLAKAVHNVWYSHDRGRDWSTAKAEKNDPSFVYAGNLIASPSSVWLEEGERGSIQFHGQLPSGRRTPLLAGTVIRFRITTKDESGSRNYVLDLNVERVDRRVEVKHWLVRHLERF